MAVEYPRDLPRPWGGIRVAASVLSPGKGGGALKPPPPTLSQEAPMGEHAPPALLLLSLGEALTATFLPLPPQFLLT